MLDIKLIRSNPELVKENIKKKFQDEKLPLVDEVLELDAQFRASKGRGDELRQQRNTISKEIGKLMSQGKKDEAQEVKKQVQAIAGELEEMERKEAEELYRAFGKAWAKFPDGWKLYLLSSHTEFERTFGKQADKKRKLYNGMLKCDLFMYGIK